MIKKLLLTIVMIMTTNTFSETIISPRNPNIQYYGRFDRSDPEKAAFDWPGVYIKTAFDGTSCKVVFEGKNCFDVIIDGIKTDELVTGAERKIYTIAVNLSDTIHRLTIAKRSESADHPSYFEGFILDNGKKLHPLPPPPSRKIEFIGDSYTAGFGNEYLKRECLPEQADSILFRLTNTNASFGALIARAFGAQYQINAISGRGLVRNYNGFDPGKEFLYYYYHTLISSSGDPQKKIWNFSSWKPDIVVIGLGLNDFLSDPPYADPVAFDKVYSNFLSRIRKQYPGVKIICCATKVTPTQMLIPRVKHILELQKKQGFKDIWYYEYDTANNALYGHPDIHDHK
ncbi:MAG: hypothetical protein GX640_13730, partial [Fibrobacter sp.]|nr:hypothetical protein [Fibrobacter sp.]